MIEAEMMFLQKKRRNLATERTDHKPWAILYVTLPRDFPLQTLGGAPYRDYDLLGAS